MKTQIIVKTLLVLTTLAPAPASFGAGAAPGEKALPRFTHPREITNPYLPLADLKRDILESKSGRIERAAKPELRKTFQIGGQTVEALVVVDREFEDGKLAEVALDYFAQADDGAVYYLGEDVDEYQNGKVVGHSGAWLFGRDTQRLGLLMPGRPRVGDQFRSEDAPKISWEEDEAISVSETVTVPLGSYRGCVKIKEKLSDGTVEFKYYAPGVGCVKEEEPDKQFVLTSHETRQTKPPSAKAKQGDPNAQSHSAQGSGSPKPEPQDPLARAALSLVGADPFAEAYWNDAINDPSLPAQERQDLIEDLNEDGLSDPQHPGPQDLPLIASRIALIEQLAPFAMDPVNADAFAEAYKDLVNLLRGQAPQ